MMYKSENFEKLFEILMRDTKNIRLICEKFYELGKIDALKESIFNKQEGLEN